jgi:hypothetical protein
MSIYALGLNFIHSSVVNLGHDWLPWLHTTHTYVHTYA